MDATHELPEPSQPSPPASFHLMVLRDAPGIERRLRSALDSAGLEHRLIRLGANPAALATDGAPETQNLLQERARPRTLLLVDDEEYILAALRRVLRREDYRILTASNGEQALALLTDDDVDVIISDQRMPAMTGVEFLSRSRTLRPNAVRIVLSGYSEFQSIADAINEGAIYRFISKPWDDAQLVNQIREAFAHKAIVDENHRLERELTAASELMASANAILRSLLAEQQARGDHGEATLAVVREVLQYAPTPIIGIDDEGLLVLVNPAAERLFGNDVRILGAHASDALPVSLHDICSDDFTASAIDCGGVRYNVATHKMGLHSTSSGRLLVLTPGADVGDEVPA